MAFALTRGQFPACCKLCMAEKKLSWKCQDCDLLMCNRCKEIIHPNIKNAKYHKVMDIKEVGESQTEEPDFSNIPCKKHEGLVCVMFCKSCDQLVCPQCISKIHNHGHGLVGIDEGYKIQTNRLKKGQNQVKNHLDLLTEEGTKIEETKKAENAKYMKTKEMIQAHNKALKAAVDEYTDKLMKEVDHKWKLLVSSIEEEESRMVTLKQNMKDKTQQVEKILNSSDVENIFEESKRLKKYLKRGLPLPDISFNSMPIFLPGEINQYIFGSIQDTYREVSVKVLKEFTTDISCVFYMSPECNDSLWISSDSVVQKVHLGVNNMKVMSSYNIQVYDIAVTPSNDLLIAGSGSALKTISRRTGEIEDSVYSIQPLCLAAVHVTSDYKIIIGALSPGKSFPVTGRRALIVMDKDGLHQTTYEYDRNNRPIFSLPRSITSTQNGNFCIVDRLSSDALGRVVVLGQGGDFINIYHGHPDINTKDHPFKPVSIETTPSNRLIVSDTDTHSLHILNNLGHLITYVYTKDIGIKWPFSLAFTTSGRIFIGCKSYDRAKLYEVNISMVKYH